jgi:Putative zinc-finger
LEHPDDDAIERYAMNQASEEEDEQVETHILGCRACQDRLQLTDEFLAALRIALKSME